MPGEKTVLPFFQWLFVGSETEWGALWLFLAMAGVLAFFGLMASWLIVSVRYGPLKAGDMVYRTIVAGAVDISRTSPRRILALARLAFQEAIRRRVLSVLAIFALILLFAGWFLDPGHDSPAKLYMSFVLTATSYLVLLLSLFLSVFSLPADIKNRTIYTVVTKPVRPGEIVLGRIIGFAAIGTVLLSVMGLASYIFVVRALNHTHEIDEARLTPILDKGQIVGYEGDTTQANKHRHRIRLGADGAGLTELSQGHRHRVTRETGPDGEARYVVGPHLDMLEARVPVYGKIAFLDEQGQPGAGISVGKIWEYRRFIQGDSEAAAYWTFEDVTREAYGSILPVEMTIRVFRTHKGNIEEGVAGSVWVRNPITGLESQPIDFTAKDNQIDWRPIREEGLLDSAGNPVLLFPDPNRPDLPALVDNGNVEVWVQCSEKGQLYGMGQGDLYLRSPNASFRLNFLKGYIGIWLQMLLMTSLGVMFSTFLSGAVAMMATIGALIMGFFTQFVLDLAFSVFNPANPKLYGGGPIESLMRIVTQENIMVDLDPTLTTQVVKMVDKVLMLFMQAVASLVPNFRSFNDASYVAKGFNIPGDLLAAHSITGLAYVFVLFIAGYFFLKTREVAR